MKFEDLKVGMMVKAIDNFYIMTAKKRKWVGTVYKICDDGTFIAKTESSIYTADKNRIYECLHPEHFEEAEPEYYFDKNKLEEQEKNRRDFCFYYSCNITILFIYWYTFYDMCITQ